MGDALNKFINVWEADKNRGLTDTVPSYLTLDNLASSITSTGPFYYYVVDFSDYSLSHVSPSMQGINGLDPATATFADILDTIHPDDMNFVAKAEAFCANVYYTKVASKDLMKYKTNFNFRCRLKDGSYGMINHQALMLTLAPDGGMGKALNIHTHIDHLTTTNTYLCSLINIEGGESFMNMTVDSDIKNISGFSRKEIQIIKHLADGFGSDDIAEKLFISPLTVKKHRTNILKKASCKNVAQLIRNSVMQGLI